MNVTLVIFYKHNKVAALILVSRQPLLGVQHAADQLQDQAARVF